MAFYNASAILHIGEAGLEYLDEYEDVRMISFESCAQNAREVLGSQARRGCVARRVIEILPGGQIQRRVEFFTSSPTIFLLDSDDEFRRLRFSVEELGWKLI